MMLRILLRLLGLYYEILLPGLKTHQALQQNLPAKNDWLKYWVVFACLFGLQKFSDLFFGLLPFYEDFKLILSPCLWVKTPLISVWLYDLFISALLDKNANNIEQLLQQCKQLSLKLLKKLALKVLCEMWNWFKNLLKPSKINDAQLAIDSTKMNNQAEENYMKLIELTDQLLLKTDAQTAVLSETEEETIPNIEEPSPQLPDKQAEIVVLLGALQSRLDKIRQIREMRP